jgi:hypothetical protein
MVSRNLVQTPAYHAKDYTWGDTNVPSIGCSGNKYWYNVVKPASKLGTGKIGAFKRHKAYETLASAIGFTAEE